MKIELWTLKVAGKHKNTFTYWKTIKSEFIPQIGNTLIYTTKTGNSTSFNIKNIEYEVKHGILRCQLCIEKIR